MDTATASPPTDVMGIRAAAKELGKAPSTISRQVARGLIPNRGTEKEPKVSLAEARANREVGLAPVVQQASGLALFRTDHERIKAEKAAIELARIKGELVSRAEVEECAAVRSSELRDTLIRRWRVFAAELVGLTAREIEEKGVAADESALLGFLQNLV